MLEFKYLSQKAMNLTLVFEYRVKTCPSIFQVEENRPAGPIQRDLVLGHVVAVVTLSADDIRSEQQTTAGPAQPRQQAAHTHQQTAVSCIK